jgi:hypothetical protein
VSLGSTIANGGGVAPNFSGDWVMVGSKSDFGSIPAPASFTRRIVHYDPKIEITDLQVGGAPPSTRSMSTDGKPSRLEINGTVTSASIVWENSALVATTVLDDINLKIIDRMVLSEDGNILTSKSVVSSPQGEVVLTVVFERPR